MKPTTIWTLDEAKGLHIHSPGLADWIAGKLHKYTPVFDLGCGKGGYLKRLDDADFLNVLGFEGTPGIKTISLVPWNIVEFDITKEIIATETGNVICLEVLEHIHKSDEAAVLKNIKNLCNNTLILSWAVVGQHGHGHINCQNADYVVPTIEALGFKVDWDLTREARYAAVNNGPMYFNDTLYYFKRV